MTTTKTKRPKPKISTRAIALTVAGILFLIPLVFEFDGLSDAGHRMFAIFLIAIVLWVVEPIPLYATAVLIIILEILMISDKAIVDLPAAFEPRAFSGCCASCRTSSCSSSSRASAGSTTGAERPGLDLPRDRASPPFRPFSL